MNIFAFVRMAMAQSLRRLATAVRIKTKFIAWAALAAVSTHLALACDLCSVYSAQEAQGGGQGFYAGAAEQFTYFGKLLNGGQELPASGEYIDSSVSQLFLGYNFNPTFGLQFNLPIIYRSYGSATNSGSETGIGDASLVGNVFLYRKFTETFTFNWSALGGVKFPTGDPSWLGKPDFAPGIGGHDLALGSGSYDALVGTGFFTRWGRWFLDGQMQYAIRTEGDFEHRYANDWTWSGGPGVYLALEHTHTLSLQAAISGETKGKDNFAGVPDNDSAETIVYLGPKIDFSWSSKLSADLGADFPVSRKNSGEQLLPEYRIHAAVIWRF
jgi:hypothetical protein